MGSERFEGVVERVSIADAWQLDRRQFLKLASAAGLAGLAGCVGAQETGSIPPLQPALGPGPIAGASPVWTSIDDLARSLDFDVQKIFRFVADEVRYEPYPGVLRGAIGTLQSRAGNSADQTLLLAALLDASLVPYRFVEGPLAAGRDQQILAAAAVDAPTAIEEAAATLRTIPPTVSAPDPANLDPGLQAIVARREELTQAVDAAIVTQLDSTTRMISGALATAGISVSSAMTPFPVRERDRHAWLQFASGPEWVDIDPVLPGTNAGETLATSGEPSRQMPDDARHRVTFSIVEESISGGALSQSTILEHTEFASDIAGIPVSFVTEKPEGLKGIGISIADTITGTLQYVPMLMVGQTVITADTNITFGTGGGIFSNEPAGSGEGETTALWHTVRIDVPDAAPIVAQRELFDRIGAAARAGGGVDLTALAPVQLVDLGPDSPKEYVPCRSVRFLAVAGGATGLGALLSAKTDSAPWGFDHFGHAYHNMRDSVAAGWGVPRGVWTFCDAPNVASLSIGFTPQSDGTVQPAMGVDIWHRSFGLLPVTGTSVSDPPGVVAGVLSHAAERVMFGEGMPSDLGSPPPRASVGRVFEEAARTGVGVRAIRGDVPSDLTYPADAATRLRAALADGWVAIVPDRPVPLDGVPRLGWWLVNPDSGATVDMLDNGGGTSFTDYARLLWNWFRALPWWKQMGICIAVTGLFAAVAVAVGLSSASDKVKAGVGLGAGLGAYAFDKAACGGASPQAPGP